MALEIPGGDDRGYDELLADARKRIPALAAAWTDHNAHDPGITTLEMLAWLTETYRYQFDRVEDRHLRAYLRLVGESPTPPLPATARLALTLPDGHADTELPVGAPVHADAGTLDERDFSTTSPVALTRARLARVVSEYDGRVVDHTTANDAEGLHYLAFGPRAEAGCVLSLGFVGDPFATNDRLDLWVVYHESGLVPPAPDPGEEPTARYAWLWPDDAGERESEAHPADEAEARSTGAYEPSVVASWEFCADYESAWSDDAWEAFAVDDHTTDLYHGGRVGLTLTDDARPRWPSEPGSIGDDAESYYWIRCTLRPRERPLDRLYRPCLGDWAEDELEDARPPTHDLPPQFEHIALNVVEAAHLTLVEVPTRLLRADGRGDTSVTTARPDQTFAFETAPVLAADVVTYASGEEGASASDDAERREWTCVTHFDASTPDDDHVRLVPETGTLRFGDGIRGRPPRPGQAVEARRTLVGGGEAGNVPLSATWHYLLDAGDDAERLVPATALSDATGGAPAESPADALDRVRRALAEPTRAVTLADYRQLALETPGLRVGRAAAMVASTEPPAGCVGSNAVRVVVVPFSTRDRPEPSEGFLRAVRCHLRRHALITDRVVVDAPAYVGVGVRVEVGLDADAAEATVQAAVADALDAFLAPLTEQGEGWPFGRSVYPSEVYEVVESVDGVRCVLDVGFAVEGPGRLEADNSVSLPETGLCYPLGHDVRVRTGSDACRGAWR